MKKNSQKRKKVIVIVIVYMKCRNFKYVEEPMDIKIFKVFKNLIDFGRPKKKNLRGI
jgi:hypothetical protein